MRWAAGMLAACAVAFVAPSVERFGLGLVVMWIAVVAAAMLAAIGARRRWEAPGRSGRVCLVLLLSAWPLTLLWAIGATMLDEILAGC